LSLKLHCLYLSILNGLIGLPVNTQDVKGCSHLLSEDEAATFKPYPIPSLIEFFKKQPDMCQIRVIPNGLIRNIRNFNE